MAAAFAPAASPEELRAALLARQLHPSEPRPLGRRLELPEGMAEPRFSLISLPPEETPGLDSFICFHLTPELLRRPEWLYHPNGASGLSGIHVLVENTAALLEPYDRLFGIQQVTTTDAVVCVHVGRHRILFSTADDFSTMYPKLDIATDFPLPGIVAVEFAIGSRESTAGYLAGRQVSFEEIPEGSLVVPAREANGVMLFFSSAQRDTPGVNRRGLPERR
jgi:hypothetical protein